LSSDDKRQEENPAAVLKIAEEDRDNGIAVHVGPVALCEKDIRLIEEQHAAPPVCKRESLLQTVLYLSRCLTNVTFERQLSFQPAAQWTHQ